MLENFRAALRRLSKKGFERHNDPNFVAFWPARTISLLGDQIIDLAVPLTAALLLGATPAEMGLLTASIFSPLLLLGFVVGAWLDRLRRRPLLIGMDLARSAILLVVPLAALGGVLRIELLYVVGFIDGACTAVFDLAKLAYTPSLVGRTRLLEANSRLEAGQSVVRLVGPGLAGLLVQLVTAPIAVVLDILSYLLSALLLGRIRVREPEPTRPGTRQPLWREIAQGYSLSRGTRSSAR